MAVGHFPTNLFALTEEGSTFPAYISINAEGDRVDITVRGDGVGGACGQTATFSLNRAELEHMLTHIRVELHHMDQRAGK